MPRAGLRSGPKPRRLALPDKTTSPGMGLLRSPAQGKPAHYKTQVKPHYLEIHQCPTDNWLITTDSQVKSFLSYKIFPETLQAMRICPRLMTDGSVPKQKPRKKSKLSKPAAGQVLGKGEHARFRPNARSSNLFKPTLQLAYALPACIALVCLAAGCGHSEPMAAGH